MSLKDFLGDEANFHFREELFNHRLLYDLKLATITARGYALLTYKCDVDHDGFDVILDDRDHLKKTQLKAKARWTKTASWDIHRTIIRPAAITMERLGFEPGSWGVEGGVVLIEFDVDEKTNQVDVRYRFSDIYTITAIALEMLPRHPNTVEAAQHLRGDLFNGNSNDKIGVGAGLFIPAADAQHLLTLIGLHSGLHGGNWRTSVLRAASGTWEPGSDVNEDEVQNLKKNFIDTMRIVSGINAP